MAEPQRRGGAGWARFTVGPCLADFRRAGQDEASPVLIMRVQVRMDVRPGRRLTSEPVSKMQKSLECSRSWRLAPAVPSRCDLFEGENHSGF